jgi:hypothetical protein
MGISKHGKARSEPESQDRQDQMFETYLEGFSYTFPDFIHTQSHQKSLQYILHKN